MMSTSLVLLRKSASKRASLAALTSSVESLLNNHTRKHSHFLPSQSEPIVSRNASSSIDWFSGVVGRRSFHSGSALNFRVSVPLMQTEYAVADFMDDDKSDDGLVIAKLGISDQIVSALEKKGITKLFPIQVYISLHCYCNSHICVYVS
ncbi:hypothetical protein CsSME_00017948 [Camellia sinensis var. sinensis]